MDKCSSLDVNRLKEARIVPLWVELRAGGEPQTAGDRHAQVGENVAKKVGGHNNIQALRPGDDPCSQRIDELLLMGDIRVPGSHQPKNQCMTRSPNRVFQAEMASLSAVRHSPSSLRNDCSPSFVRRTARLFGTRLTQPRSRKHRASAAPKVPAT